MTNEQINIAIAEVSGDIIIKGEWTTEEIIQCGAIREIRNYCRDLNAMHEAVNTLNEEQKEKYFFNLMCVFGNWPKAIQATAKQRAEAFLRTLGKWKD